MFIILFFTSFTVTPVPMTGGDIKTWRYIDADGNGSTAPAISGSTLLNTITYLGSIQILKSNFQTVFKPVRVY